MRAWTLGSIVLAAGCLLACAADDGGGSDGMGGSAADDGRSGNVDDGGGGADSTGTAPDRASTILGLEGDAAAGGNVFASTCSLMSCHGASGDDGSAPALSDRVPSLTPEQIVTTLLEGKMGMGMAMPSQAHLSDQELADVLTYVEATFG